MSDQDPDSTRHIATTVLLGVGLCVVLIVAIIVLFYLVAWMAAPGGAD